MSWKRIEVDKRYHSEFAVLQRFYRKEKREWPKISIGIYEHGGRVSANVSEKNSEDAFWSSEGLPILPKELIPEMIEMLEEYYNSPDANECEEEFDYREEWQADLEENW